jgi:hypothetical protein
MKFWRRGRANVTENQTTATEREYTREEMREACQNNYAAARQAAMEEAAKICEEQQRSFLSEQYAVNQPMSSFSERFACGQCAKAIRTAAGLPDPQAEWPED